MVARGDGRVAACHPQEAAIQIVVQLLTEHPELTPFVLEFLETLVRERLVERA
jgi:hypothetical protein